MPRTRRAPNSHDLPYKQWRDTTARHEQEWNALVSNWQQGLARVHATAEEITRETTDLFPPWTSPVWNTWMPSTTVPPVIYFGTYRVDLADLPRGLSEHERLEPTGPTRHMLPALLDFPGR